MKHQFQILPVAFYDAQLLSKIEREVFEFPWSSSEFLEYIIEKDHVGVIAATMIPQERDVVGYALGIKRKQTLNIENIAVLPSFRRQGIGMRMLGKLIRSCQPQSITALVRESNQQALGFFQRLHFRGRLVRQPYRDCHEDGIQFVRMQCKRLPPQKTNKEK